MRRKKWFLKEGEFCAKPLVRMTFPNDWSEAHCPLAHEIACNFYFSFVIFNCWIRDGEKRIFVSTSIFQIYLIFNNYWKRLSMMWIIVGNLVLRSLVEKANLANQKNWTRDLGTRLRRMLSTSVKVAIACENKTYLTFAWTF